MVYPPNGPAGGHGMARQRIPARRGFTPRPTRRRRRPLSHATSRESTQTTAMVTLDAISAAPYHARTGAGGTFRRQRRLMNDPAIDSRGTTPTGRCCCLWLSFTPPSHVLPPRHQESP
jgi:hypothetical protein